MTQPIIYPFKLFDNLGMGKLREINIAFTRNAIIKIVAESSRNSADEYACLWGSLLDTYAQIIMEWYAWKELGVWNDKYFADSPISLEHTKHEEMLGVSLGKSLFTSLDTFLLKPNQEMNITHNKLRIGGKLDGITPSLYTFLQELESVILLQNRCHLVKIRRKLAKFTYDQKRGFWKRITRSKNFENKSEHDKIIMVKKMADAQLKRGSENPELIATYIKTPRNPMAHNHGLTCLEEVYLLQVGYTTDGMQILNIILDICYNFLKQINLEIFQQDNQCLDAWNDELHNYAKKISLDIKQTLHQTIGERNMEEHEKINQQWCSQQLKRDNSIPIESHICCINMPMLPTKFRYSNFQQCFYDFCNICSAKIEIIYLERGYENFEVSIVSEDGKNILSAISEKCIILDGKWYICIIIEYHSEKVNIFPEEYLKDYEICIILEGEVLWKFMTSIDQLLTSNTVLKLYIPKLKVPVERYLSIMRKSRKLQQYGSPASEI